MRVAFDPKCHHEGASISIFLTSLSVRGTAGASAKGSSQLVLREETLSLLLSFESGNYSVLCTISILAVLVGLYLTSNNFNQVNSTLSNFLDSLLSVAEITVNVDREFLGKMLKLLLSKAFRALEIVKKDPTKG